MPRPRIYKDNATRQAAYRARKAKAERPQSPGVAAVVKRVMAAEKKASA